MVLVWLYRDPVARTAASASQGAARVCWVTACPYITCGNLSEAEDSIGGGSKGGTLLALSPARLGWRHPSVEIRELIGLHEFHANLQFRHVLFHEKN